MDCKEVQASVLDSLMEPLAAGRRLAMDRHVATCDACRGFAAVQESIDVRLTAAASLARLSPEFRVSLKERIRRDPVSAWPDFLPDLAHLIGCIFAVVLLSLFLPQPSGQVIVVGLACTFVLHGLLRTSLDALDEGA